jgi:hypothetical protein
LGITRSGNGVVGTFPYSNVDEGSTNVSSHLSPLPVEPTSVTELRFDGDVGALGIKVSALPDVDTVAFDGTPKKPSSCGALLVTSSVVSSSSDAIMFIGLASIVVVSGIQDNPTGSWSVVDCCE